MNIPTKKLPFSLTIVVVIGLLFFLHYFSILRPFENLIVRAITPIGRGLMFLSNKINEWYYDRKTKNELEKEIKDLQNQLIIELNNRAKIALLEEENQFLRDQLQFIKNDQYKPLIGHLISKNSKESINTIIIDKGDKDGVKIGYPVVAGNGVIIGKIIKTSNYTSVALLINDHNSSLAASIINAEKTIGLVKGEYGLGVRMELIPQTENLKEGDLVITSGIEDNIPRGLIIGTIEKVFGDEEEIFKQAVIRLPINFNKIYEVNILIPQIHVD